MLTARARGVDVVPVYATFQKHPQAIMAHAAKGYRTLGEVLKAGTVALEPGLRTRAFIYNTLLADKSVDDRYRKFPTWVSSRNLANQASDASVQALVDAVQARGIPMRLGTAVTAVTNGMNDVAVEIDTGEVLSARAVIAADAKVSIDENALFRHADYAATSTDSAEDPIEAEAAKRGIAYVRLGGDIGIIGNGAGLVMCSLDEVSRAGGKPADFLDVGGGAQAERVKSCVELVMMDPNIRGILINIFGGITRGDEVAKGILSALNELKLSVPVVARIEGTGAEEGRKLLASSSLVPAETMQEAAKKIVELSYA